MSDLIYNKIYAKIKEAKNILLVTHERPDIDAVASVCAWAEFLNSLGISYNIYSPGPVPHQFNFIPHIEKVGTDKAAFDFKNFDLIIVFDCGDIKRTGLADEIWSRGKSQYIIEADHHAKNGNYADLELREPAASTTELVYNFFKINKIKINKNIATCVLAGILTDSGSFIYPSTSNKTVEISGEMLVRGANLGLILENSWRNKSLPALKIWGEALSRLALNDKYKIAFSVLTLKDIEAVDEEDLEGISNFLGNLNGVKAVLLLREQKNGTVRGSLRSAHPTADVAALARALGGGGHVKASGFTIEGRLEKTEKGWKIV
jgi:phosphoesterase RecJ-like protein